MNVPDILALDLFYFFFSFVECRLSHQNLKFDSECDNKIWCHMKYNARWLLFLSPKFVSIFRVFSPLYRIVRRAISFFFSFIIYLNVECNMVKYGAQRGTKNQNEFSGNGEHCLQVYWTVSIYVTETNDTCALKFMKSYWTLIRYNSIGPYSNLRIFFNSNNWHVCLFSSTNTDCWPITYGKQLFNSSGIDSINDWIHSNLSSFF